MTDLITLSSKTIPYFFSSSVTSLQRGRLDGTMMVGVYVICNEHKEVEVVQPKILP